jgi:hypothetical protein
VRSVVIISFYEIIKQFLLLQKVIGRRFRRFFLQGQVHALMPAVLLRVARLNAFDRDAQAEPPDGKLAQAEQSMGIGERDAVVGTNRGKQWRPELPGLH